MSVRKEQLRRLVLQRLVTAAEEIFCLFEKAFTEHQEELEELRRRLQEKTEGDIQTITVGVDSDGGVKADPVNVKQEEAAPFAIALPSMKHEGNGPNSAPQREGKEDRPDRKGPSGEVPGGEEDRPDRKGPGCCLDLNHSDPLYGRSDKNSNNREFRMSVSDGHDVNMSQDSEVSDRTSEVSDRTSEVSDRTWESSNTVVVAAAVVAGGSQEQLHRCEQCFKSFKTRQILKGHIKTHALQGTFPCPVCHKVYSHKNTFNQHMRLHSEQNPYCCSICDRRFTQKGHFIEHLRIHTGEKPFNCADCGMKFRLRNIRDRHVLRMHGGQRPHTCPICHKGFVSRCYFVDHMRTHTGERPFSCAVCDKTYLSKESLKKHTRIHEDHRGLNAVLE